MINWKDLLYPYEQAVNELELKFRSIAKGHREMGNYSPIEMVYGRVKDRSSIIDKANKKNIPLERIEEKIVDIAGIRIVARFVEDISKIIDLIRNRADMKIIKEKDYITHTKASGYRSYHIIIKYPIMTLFGYRELTAEIQIRTMAMNFWASAEHSLHYKYSGNIPAELKERLVSCAEAAHNLDKEMATIRGEIMEAQKIILRKTNLVQEILDNMQRLNNKIKIEELNDLNKKFFDIYSEGDIDLLFSFNRQLLVLDELYHEKPSY